MRNKKSYYAVFDLQIDGYKAGMVSDDLNEVVSMVKDRIETIHEDWFEPDYPESPQNLKELENRHTTKEILSMFDYEIHVVSQETANVIENSDNYGLLSSVEGVDTSQLTVEF